MTLWHLDIIMTYRNEMVMPEFSWQSIKGVRNLKEVRILDCIYHPGPENLSSIYIPEADPEDTPFTEEGLQNAQVKDA